MQYRELASGPFYGFSRPGVDPSEAIIENWRRQGITGSAKAHCDGIVAFSQNGTHSRPAGLSHGMPTTQADTINTDLVTFVQS
jgi:non-heme chloroperoxidase